MKYVKTTRTFQVEQKTAWLLVTSCQKTKEIRKPGYVFDANWCNIVLEGEIMKIVVVAARADDEVYEIASERKSYDDK